MYPSKSFSDEDIPPELQSSASLCIPSHFLTEETFRRKNRLLFKLKDSHRLSPRSLLVLVNVDGFAQCQENNSVDCTRSAPCLMRIHHRIIGYQIFVRQKLRSVIPCTYLMNSHVKYEILHLTTTTHAFAEPNQKLSCINNTPKKQPNAVQPTETLPAQTPPPLPPQAVDNPVANAAAAINVPAP